MSIEYDQMYNKYVQLAKTKTPFQISENILTPTMGEMLEEDLAYDSLLQINGDIDGSGDPVKASFYYDRPILDKLGYSKEYKALFVKGKVYEEKYNGTDIQWLWNKSDGDTLTYKVKDIDAGSDPIETDIGTYKNFKEYFFSSAKTIPSDKAKFAVRFVGMNCAEIPHFEAITINKDDAKDLLVKAKYGDIKNNPNYVLWKFPTSDKKTFVNLKDDQELLFYKQTDGGEMIYHEVIQTKSLKPIPPSSLKIDKSIDELANSSSFRLPDPSGSTTGGFKKGFNINLLIVVKDDSQKNSIRDAYVAQEAVKSRLEAANYETYMILDAKNLSITNTYKNELFPIFNLFLTPEYCKKLIDQILNRNSNLRLSGYSYGPLGTDVYGRYLSAIYTKAEGDRWININKFVIANTKNTEVMPNYSGHPELNNKELSDAFELWTYDFSRFRWLDSFEELTEKSYEERIRLHEGLTGTKFCELRGNTVLIGDTLLLIPPTNIRSVSQTTYERTPLLRSKGQMVKGGNQNESLLELTMFFVGDHGINGIPRKFKLPSGEEVTYYMNGLRSLIAQFKLTPFLPIENEYINDVLGIEAVSLLNMSVNTVPEFPQMLQVTLTLRDFNYRIFMPDLPLPLEVDQTITKSSLAQMTPIFAKAFQWEVFRYYYQRLMLAGETIKKYTYNSASYNEYLYRSITALQPTLLCNSNISFYIPDIDWLDTALKLKIDADTSMVDFKQLELTENARNYAKDIADKSDKLSQVSDSSKEIKDYLKEKGTLFDPEVQKKLNINESFKTKYPDKNYLNGESALRNIGLNYGGDYGSDRNVIGLYYKPIQDKISNALMPTGLFSRIYGTESLIKNKVPGDSSEQSMSLVWSINAEFGDNNLSEQEWSTLREFIADNLEEDKKIVLNDNALSIVVTINADKEGNVLNANYDSSLFDKIIYNLGLIGDGKITNADKNQMINEQFNYRDPAKMIFVPYIEDALVSEMSISLSNTFTETKLKSVDGISGQYVGGQDAGINIRLVTCDELLVSTIAALKDISFQFATEYKRIMSCTPIRIKNDLAQMYGLNEVTIDMIDINTMEEIPGAYEITLKMTSVDRTIRQRETLRKMDFTTNGGFVGTGEGGTQKMRSYFDLDSVLSNVEVYPDLELPTLAELKLRGYCYIRYSLSNSKRAYPDPDFYMVYANSYSAAIMKAQVKEFFQSLQDETKDTSGLEHYEVMDSETKEKFLGKLDEVVGLHLINENETAKITNTLRNDIQKTYNSEQKEVKKNSEKNRKKDAKNTEKALKYLLASNVTDGWNIKPTWSAPLCDAGTNDLIKQLPKAGSEESNDDQTNHQAIAQIKSTRRRLIEAIDAVLNKPIKMPDVITKDIDTLHTEQQEEKIYKSIEKVVGEFFATQEGMTIMNCLNPVLNKYQGCNVNDPILGHKWKYANVEVYITGFMYAAACINSSQKEYEEGLLDGIVNFDRLDGTWGPRMWYNESSSAGWFNKDNSTPRIPLCRVGSTNVGMVKYEYKKDGSIKREYKTNEEIEKATLEAAINTGTIFGPFGIKMYTRDEIETMTINDLPYKYVDDKDVPLYKQPMHLQYGLRGGFLDPYYNNFGTKVDSDTLRKYKKGIMINSEIAAMAFLRNCLVWLRKMIYDGLFISEVDVLAKDLAKAFKMFPNIDLEDDDAREQLKEVLRSMNGGLLGYISAGAKADRLIDKREKAKEKEKEEAKKTEQERQNEGNEESVGQTLKNIFNTEDPEDIDLYLIYASLSDLLPKSLCMRMIYPIYLAATSGSPLLLNDIKARNYDGLDSAVNSCLGGGTDDKLNRDLRTFFKALAGLGMIELADLEKTWTDLSQKMINSVNKEVYLEFANNPKIFLMHSYYDMLMNDKRGRLVRAFPTYYMILIDEGRKIGQWKLHDNFYNMSAISSIDIIKSRKNPADTCSVVMTNNYNSYATEYDNTTQYKYTDLYGVQDVFNSIFSPERYYEKADQIRRDAIVKDKVVLKPGVRMHIRMGYSADAATMPPMFNGRITEVNAGEVVDIVAQGDGVELVNPLNVLGNIEANQIDTAQSLIFPSVFTDLRGSWSKGGWSPRNLLATVLNAEYGGLEGIANHISNGQFFNTNPFGITHFGDMRYTSIFEQGEPTQNIYEVTDDDLLPDMNVIYKDPAKKESTPIINCSLYDKTFWDLMHMSARAGVDYNCAIRDFGFRSTIFLGKNNYYYAYAYKKINGNIYEKRKPFQQYHYIEPYNDIIYNTIKASERDIKTNATGIWQGTNMTFGRKTKTVGPVYLDINIYPEYQKSMTYDTGLLADGNGGIDIGFITALGEGHAFGRRSNEDETYDDKVNVQLAERMTINALKDAVKDMYTGEVCIIGSPGIKPFDRVHIYDQQEDMSGDFEVETVIHSLNANTGFTTTIHPDLIVRQKENQMEVATRSVVSKLMMCLRSSALLYAYRHTFSRVNSKLLTSIAKSSPVNFATGKLADTIGKSKIIFQHFDKLDTSKLEVLNDVLKEKMPSAANSLTTALTKAHMKSTSYIIDDILKLNINEGSSAADLVKYLGKLERLDLDTLNKNIDHLIEMGEKSGLSATEIRNLEKQRDLVTKSYNSIFDNGKFDVTELFDELNKNNLLDIEDDIFKHFSAQEFKIKNREDIKLFNKLFKSDDILDAITVGAKPGHEAIQKAFNSTIKNSATKFVIGNADEVGTGILKKLLSSTSSALSKVGGGVFSKLGSIGGFAGFAVGLAIDMAVDMAITYVVGSAARSIFEPWFDHLQTLTIYPMKQYGMNFTAGISGSKACTYGAPPQDGWNSIQGMLIQAYESVGRMNPAAKFFVEPFVNTFIISEEEFKKTATRYKVSLGLEEETEISKDDIAEKLYSTVSANMDKYGTSKQALMTRARIQSFKKEDKGVISSYSKYAINNLDPTQISTDKKIKDLVALEFYPSIQSYVADGRLKIAHNESKGSPIKIRINNKDITLNALPSNVSGGKQVSMDYPDLPMLHKDASTVLKEVLDKTYSDPNYEDTKYVFYSGTVVNSNDFRSTGFLFTLRANKDVTKLIKKVQANINSNNYKVFDFYLSKASTSKEKYYNFKLYPPVATQK